MVEATTEQSPALIGEPRRNPVNLRSILLGLLGVILICGLTAYNDYVVANTFVVGNFLPIGLLLFFLVLILLVNAPLHRFAPRLAFSTGEMSVVLGMMLVSCALPSSGLMRYLPAHLVAPWYHAGSNSDYATVLKQVGLPDWLFPTMEREGAGRANDPVVKYFWNRTPLDADTLANRINAVPWAAWLRPTVVWGAFVALVMGAMLCGSVIFRRQWVENERLAYPLANVYLSLIEEPSPKRMLNTLFSSRWFWGAAILVFLIHGFNAMNKYDPRIWPQIPIGYAFGGIFADPPLSYIDWGAKSATLYFCMIGITYFLQSNVAFSLWFCFILLQITKMSYGSYSAELTWGMTTDQNFGAVIVFALSVLFIGREQIWLILRHMFWRNRPGDPQGRYLPYSVAGWGMVLCLVGLVAWLMAAGATLVGGIVIVAMASLCYLVLARVVAETGLMFVQLSLGMDKPWTLAATALPEALAAKTTATSYFMTNWIGNILVHDARESIAGFMPQALRVADSAAYEKEVGWRRAIGFTLCLVLALAVGYLVSGAGMLYMEYNYSSTADRSQASPINPYAMDVSKSPMEATKSYIEKGGASESHNRWAHVGFGAGITGALSLLRLRFVSWPIHPVGYLLVFSYPMQKIWFSVFVGWLMKVVIVKYGGATMYRQAKPLFMGLIIGEVGAAAFWLIVSLVLNTLGLQYHAIMLLPA